MALIECKECGKEISDTAATCPSCGATTEITRRNRKKAIKVLSMVVILIVLVLAAIFVIQRINDKTNLSEKEVVEYLKGKGYEFKATKFIDSSYATYYIYVNNENIAFQRIDNVFLGIMYSWSDRNVNNEWADIYKNDNDTNAEKNQYEAYQKWLKTLGLNETQIIDALNYYESITTKYETMN